MTVLEVGKLYRMKSCWDDFLELEVYPEENVKFRRAKKRSIRSQDVFMVLSKPLPMKLLSDDDDTAAPVVLVKVLVVDKVSLLKINEAQFAEIFERVL
jgi:hypothetical protein